MIQTWRALLERSSTNIWRAGVGLLLCAGTLNPLTALGQAPAPIQAPDYRATDANFINLVAANLDVEKVSPLSIGSGASTLEHHFFAPGGTPGYNLYAGDSYIGVGYPNHGTRGLGAYCTSVGLPSIIQITIGATNDYLCGASTASYTSVTGQGSTLTTNAGGTLTYIQRDGSVWLFGPDGNGLFIPTRLTAPDGRITTITYKQVVVSGPSGPVTYSRIQSVTRTDGLQLKYSYASNATPAYGTATPWFRTTSVTAINNTVDYCDPAADTCSYSVSWPATSVSTDSGITTLTFTDPAGQTEQYVINIYGVKSIKPPSSASAAVLAYTYCAEAGSPPGICVSTTAIYQVTRDGSTVWQYSQTSMPSGDNSSVVTQARSPLGAYASAHFDTSNAPKPSPTMSATTEDGTNYVMDNSTPADFPVTVQKPEGNTIGYAYDSRGNVTSRTDTPKPGSTLAVTSTTANYDASCTYPVKCNKPNWIIDSNNNKTDYTYDTTQGHGGLLTESLPADSNGVRPQKRYSYMQLSAWIKNSSGGYSPSALIWVLSSMSYCISGTWNGTNCVNAQGQTIAGDLVTTTYNYGPNSGPNNLFLRGQTVTAGSPPVSHVSCYSYDVYGNKISETSPNAGLTSCP